MAKRIPKTLYHYCSVDTFYNIIKNKSLWLSDISKSNDSRELQWLKGQCETYILNSWLEYLKGLEQENRLTSQDFVGVNESKEWLKYINEETSKSWIFCLSEKKDDLGQWRGYADDGYGISIGFKTDFFVVVEKIAEIIDKNELLFFGKVRYSKKEVKDFFMNYAELKEISTKDTTEQVLERIKKAIGLTMWNSAFFKCETFKEEKEWRIAYSMELLDILKGTIPGIPDDKNEYKSAITLGNYGFNVRNKTLVSHVELGIPHLEKVISEICIGPKSPLEVQDVKMFLISQGLLKDFYDKSIKVYKSEASYR